MNRFRNTINSCELPEIHLQDRRFTWSNEPELPTLVKLDRVFCNTEWDMAFGSHVLHAPFMSLSDHYPLLLSNDSGSPRPRAFKFQNFWIKMSGFMEVMPNMWNEPCNHVEPYHIMFNRLQRTAQKTKSVEQLHFF